VLTGGAEHLEHLVVVVGDVAVLQVARAEAELVAPKGNSLNGDAVATERAHEREPRVEEPEHDDRPLVRFVREHGDSGRLTLWRSAGSSSTSTASSSTPRARRGSRSRSCTASTGTSCRGGSGRPGSGRSAPNSSRTHISRSSLDVRSTAMRSTRGAAPGKTS